MVSRWSMWGLFGCVSALVACGESGGRDSTCGVDGLELVRPWSPSAEGALLGPVAASETQVFVQAEGQILGASLTDGAWSPVWTNPAAVPVPLTFWAQGERLLLWQGALGGFTRVPLDGGTPVPLPTLPFEIAGEPSIAFSGAFDSDGALYAFSEATRGADARPSTLYRIDLDAGGITPLAALTDSAPGRVALRGDFVYFVTRPASASGAPPGPTVDTMHRVPKAGGPVEALPLGVGEADATALSVALFGPTGDRLWLVVSATFAGDPVRSLETSGVYSWTGEGDATPARLGGSARVIPSTRLATVGDVGFLDVVSASQTAADVQAVVEVLRLDPSGDVRVAACLPADRIRVLGLAASAAGLFAGLEDSERDAAAVVRWPVE